MEEAEGAEGRGTRTPSWAGLLTDLVSILYIAAKKFGPGFVSVYKGKGNANLLRNRGMWCGLRKLQENLSFKQSDLAGLLLLLRAETSKNGPARKCNGAPLVARITRVIINISLCRHMEL